MKTIEYPAGSHMTSIMREVRRNKWQLIRCRYTKNAFGEEVIQLMYVEAGK